MDATSMPSLSSLLAKLRADYPELHFEPGPRDTFHPPHTIIYAPDCAPLTLLHELGHYRLAQRDFHSDIELLQIEALAWEQAKQLCDLYHVTWDEDFAQSRLDSYRDYLHFASLCPNCQVNGYQDNSGHYRCPLCHKRWPSPGRPAD